MPQTMIEKIAQKFAIGLKPNEMVHAGDFITIQPQHVMTHDNTGAVIPKFHSIGASRVANPRQPVYALDHNVQDTSEKNREKYAKIEAFARELGVDFYPAGRGIGHQIMCEEGYAWPGTMMVASDSHSNMYGGLGCLGSPIVRTDAAGIWASGKTWWKIPPIARVELIGKPRTGVTGKDIILALCGIFNKDEVLNHAIEFTGDGVGALSIDQRLTIANMTTEWGALAGVFPIDKETYNWLEQRIAFIENRGLAGVPSDADASNGVHPRMNRSRLMALKKEAATLQPDNNAFYSRTIRIDLSTIAPSVAGPHNVKTMHTVQDIEKKKIKVDKAYLVSCVNSRVEDLAQASAVIRGKKVADHVTFYVAAASSEVQAESEKRGDWQALLDAGAVALPPGCGPCIGLGTGLLEDGEVGISATNRNFKGRMGSKSAEAYLASPAVVAASAVNGFISGPDFSEHSETDCSLEIHGTPKQSGAKVDLLDGFPSFVEGNLLFCHQDNMNTDGIYPGKYTYIDDFTPEQQAEVVMENYDPQFVKIARKGDILAGGYNFGTGSSREQAATALKYKGIQLVLAGSFSETYKRNALNNGYLVLECPELIDDLKTKMGTENLTIATGMKIRIDFERSTVTFNEKNYPISPVGHAAQELVLAGGLENWVRKQLN